MEVVPLADRVLVKPDDSESKSVGGIIIPDSAREKTHQGTVIGIGGDEKITVKPGEKVMYSKYAGTSIKIDDKEHLILKMDDLIAVLK